MRPVFASDDSTYVLCCSTTRIVLCLIPSRFRRHHLSGPLRLSSYRSIVTSLFGDTLSKKANVISSDCGPARNAVSHAPALGPHSQMAPCRPTPTEKTTSQNPRQCCHAANPVGRHVQLKTLAPSSSPSGWSSSQPPCRKSKTTTGSPTDSWTQRALQLHLL